MHELQFKYPSLRSPAVFLAIHAVALLQVFFFSLEVFSIVRFGLDRTSVACLGTSPLHLQVES